MNRKKAISILLASTLMATSFSFTSFAFEDTENHWADQYTDDLEKENIVEGYEDGTFRPERYISREETAAIIDRTIEVKKAVVKGNEDELNGENLTLSDIAGLWSEKYIKSLVEKGIIKGYPDGTFQPENDITRQEFATIVFRIINPEAEGSEEKFFSDIENEWGADIIKKLTELEIIDGYPDGTFRPNDPIKRAEAAKILVKTINGKDSKGNSLIITEDSQEEEKLSENTEIKVKEGNNVVEKIDSSKILIYKSKKTDDGYQKAKFQDIVEEIEAADKSKQTYKIEDANLTDDVQPDKKFIVTSEDGKLTKSYDIEIVNRSQNAPEGLKSEKASSKDASDGKITGVNEKMEYIDSEKDKTADENWISVTGTEITELKAGKYYIRFKADTDLGLDKGEEKEINIEYKLNNTKIKKKDSAELVQKIEGTKIEMYKAKEQSDGYTEAKVSDLKSEIESTIDGDSQTYEVIKDTTAVDDESELLKDYKFKVISENGTEELYEIKFIERKQKAPKKIGSENTSSKDASDGKITGVNEKMEYIDSEKDKTADENWTSVTGTEITELKAGKYYIRYKADSRLLLKKGEAGEIEVGYTKLNNTGIKTKENSKVVKAVEEDKIIVYKSKLKKPEGIYEKATVKDIKNEITTTKSGYDNQTYTVKDSKSSELSDDEIISKGETFTVKAEDGTEKVYSIEFAYRDQMKPEGLKSEKVSSNTASDGKITGVNEKMEYIDSEKDKTADENWTSVTGTEITELKAGKYYIRYKTDDELGLNKSEEVEIEVKNLSNNRRIKKKDDAKFVTGLYLKNIKIKLSKNTSDGVVYAKAKDLKNDIELTEENQKYQVMTNNTILASEVNDDAELSGSNCLKVTAENGQSTIYSLLIVQDKPEGVKGEEGSITGLKKGMSYQKPNNDVWIDFTEEEIKQGKKTGLEPGTYKVRYQLNVGYGVAESESVDVEVL